MGSYTHGTGRDAGPARRGKFALALSLAVVVALIAAQTASATFHLILVREVYAGASNDSYVVLQAYEAGQSSVATHSLTAYDAAGGQIGEFTFSSGVANGANNMTILIADSNYAATFPGGPAPNGTMSSLDLSAAGGAVCWAGVDCASWGTFSGVTTPSAGTPAVAISGGQALRRSIAAGCPTFLEVSDDTNQSSVDFSLQTPNPRNNASTIVETPCNPPSAAIDSGPAQPKTKATSATFTFHSTPSGATFECRLDAGVFETCASGIEYSGPLAEGAHSFQVRAKNPDGTGAAATHNWEVDNTPPTTTIGNPKPPTPNSGASLTFKFSASESGSTFVCSLAKGAEAGQLLELRGLGQDLHVAHRRRLYVQGPRDRQPRQCRGRRVLPLQRRHLTPGQNAAGDDDHRQTARSEPSSSATFTYASNEAGSTFECKIDAAAFAACEATGITYNGLGEGRHTFQVRATDVHANVDLSPAGFSFDIVLPVIEAPTEIKPPEEGAGPAPPQPVAPNTRLTAKPKAKGRDRTPTFKFRATAAGATVRVPARSAGRSRPAARP